MGVAEDRLRPQLAHLHVADLQGDWMARAANKHKHAARARQLRSSSSSLVVARALEDDVRTPILGDLQHFLAQLRLRDIDAHNLALARQRLRDFQLRI